MQKIQITTYSEFANIPDPEWPGLTPKWDSLREVNEETEESKNTSEYDPASYTRKTDFAMTEKEIAGELGITDRAVRIIIERSFEKIIEQLILENPELSLPEIRENMIQFVEDRELINKSGEEWQSIKSLLAP